MLVKTKHEREEGHDSMYTDSFPRVIKSPETEGWLLKLAEEGYELLSTF